MSRPIETQADKVKLLRDVAAATRKRAAHLRSDIERQIAEALAAADKLDAEADAVETTGILCPTCTVWHAAADPDCPMNVRSGR